MSNFDIFDKTKLSALVEPFMPGATPHIIPIRYEAITPDLFALLLRTNGKDGKEYFFVSLEYDYIADIKEAEGIIAQWHGSFIEFLPPIKKQSDHTDKLERIEQKIDEVYYALLARVKQPLSGFWATRIMIRPGDSIAEKIQHLPPKQQVAIRKGLARVFAHGKTENPETSKEFPESNPTSMSIAIHIRPNGGFEFFSG